MPVHVCHAHAIATAAAFLNAPLAMAPQSRHGTAGRPSAEKWKAKAEGTTLYHSSLADAHNPLCSAWQHTWMNAQALLDIGHPLCSMLRAHSRGLAGEVMRRALVTAFHIAESCPGLHSHMQAMMLTGCS